MREYVWLRACLHDELPEVIREMIVAHAMDVRGEGLEIAPRGAILRALAAGTLTTTHIKTVVAIENDAVFMAQISVNGGRGRHELEDIDNTQ